MTHPANEQPKLDLEAVKSAIVQTIALLDVAIAGTVFTKPDAGRVVVNVAKAQSALDGLRGAFALIARVQEGEEKKPVSNSYKFTGAVEVCPDCDIADCHHIRERRKQAAREVLNMYTSPSTPKAGDEGELERGNREAERELFEAMLKWLGTRGLYDPRDYFHGGITADDIIEQLDAHEDALASPFSGISRETLGKAIYLAMYGHQGAIWEANESQDVWFEAADRLLSTLTAGASNAEGDDIGDLRRTKARLNDALSALRSIAEGNLGDRPWQAGYDTIRQVARNALSTANAEGDAR
ncbi:hypothetical protein [Phenylobacterium sp. 58.2.17]|uniref:hypothetical protein n=1 Tax=Phenylobacterium sp. 58.2.17 TaxID=2969306 RepID=UPI00226503B3|nr:hypothetical protein [Phenylobacterium sp. 58.2.17]MCX7585062.1 hypothetical protein [Phenylobacterium sp. 58.2.17]